MSSLAILLASLCLLASAASGRYVDDKKVNADDGFGNKSPSDVSGKDVVARRRRADDVDVATLQAIVQQQAATIQQMQSQLTAIQNSLPSTFSPVAFSVRFSSDNVGTGLPMSTHSILRFDHVITNVGNGYSPQTGIFTAPYAGVYCFSISIMSVNGQGHTYVAIDKHGTMLDSAFSNGHDDYDQGSTEVTVHLARGEQVWARQQGGTAIRGGSYTIFTGYLVQAD